MTDAIRPLIAGNWKMNGLKASSAEFEAMLRGRRQRSLRKADLLVCPPATLIAAFAEKARGSRREDPRGRRAGLPPQGLGRPYRRSFGRNAGGCRRQRHHCRPFRAARRSRRERRAGSAEGRSGLARRPHRHRLHRRNPAAARCRTSPRYLPAASSSGSLPDGATAGNLVVAYEPVWAIGTGLTPTAADVEQIHRFIRELLIARFNGEGAGIRILYGGSVKPSNAAELMAVANVNGALVGGASLKAADFLAIAAGCP